ncbi:MAG: TlpA disulfide reductase family protein [Acetomicrobium sp.]|jgi:peroxiredoxin|uniref:TlpA family protein disulfide reductase n=1 Tax=Acetomicrobium sp. TaxID=1872099 RepID=UPI002B2596DD|nr:TlpA disulfide reductase family protein [Acetomicrobium sp.]HPT64336.1 TlpA disulfide reductase family protein [Acetomicrobium sp.]HXK98492.1 TlpA disulfide reductase family protein [Acetomicrobium sp.]
MKINRGVSFVSLALIISLVLFPNVVALANAQKGKIAPDFEVVDLKGNTFKLSDFNGKPVLLNFWATWCPPCLSELPEFERFFKEHGQEVHLVAVNLTVSEKSVDYVKRFVEDKNLSFPVYLDSHGLTAQHYLVRYVPTSYFLDENLEVKEIHIGPLKYEEIVQKFGL